MMKPLLIACLVALVGCDGPGTTPLEPSTVAERESPPEPFHTIDEVLADIARGPIPGFAGTIQAGGRRVILMTAVGDIETARSYVDERGRRPFATVDTVVRVDYDFAQLYDWKLAIYRSPRFESMTSLDIAEQNNRIEIGAFREAVDAVRDAALDLGIPPAAIEVTRDDMIVRGTVSRIRSETSFMLADVSSEDAVRLGSLVIVHHAADVDIPPIGGCVEIQAPAVVLLSLPPQIGAHRLHRIDC